MLRTRILPRGRLLQMAVLGIGVLLLLEVAGHIVYRVQVGNWMWHETFRTRSFMEVRGGRVVPRKSFYNKEYGFQFDAQGFRIGGPVGKIIFLGDSVPFGWGVSGPDAIPYRFGKLSGLGTLNAAVPSYSLRQAVERFEHDVKEADLLFLQTLSPVPELVLYGKRWDPEINWSKAQVPQYSSLLRMLYLLAQDPLDPDDSETRERFTREIQKDLDTLPKPLVLVPANPAESYIGKTDTFSIAVDWFNTALKEYAEHDGVYYFDVVTYFDERGRGGYFLDECCHLTELGNDIQARFLLRRAREEHLLPGD